MYSGSAFATKKYATKIKNKLISEEDKEGFVLGLMMQETDYEDTIDTTEFINHLQGK